MPCLDIGECQVSLVYDLIFNISRQTETQTVSTLAIQRCDIEALRSGARTAIIANKALSSQTTTLSILSSALHGIIGCNIRFSYSMLPTN